MASPATSRTVAAHVSLSCEDKKPPAAAKDGGGMTANTLRQRRHAIAMAAARVEAKERYLEIAEAIKAEAGVRLHSVCDTLSSRCWAGVRVIEAPEGRTRRQLYVLAKACARVALHSAGKE